MHKMLKFNIKFKHENVQYFCLKEHLEVHIFSYFSQKLYRKGKEKVKKKIQVICHSCLIMHVTLVSLTVLLITQYCIHFVFTLSEDEYFCGADCFK